MNRLVGREITCPDCGKVCHRIIVERFSLRKFQINLTRKILTPLGDSWEEGEYAYRCEHCDSLNVDDVVREMGVSLEL